MNQGDDTYTIDPDWMARVKEVVDWVLEEGMYCIINAHHDTGPDNTAWIEASMNNFNSRSTVFESLWRQIANTFKDYDEHLIFEAYNEMLDETKSWCFAGMNEFNSNGNTPSYQSISTSAYQAVNAYAQKFVEVVRSTGSNNSYRNLMVNTYVASCGKDYWDAAAVELLKPLNQMANPESSSNHIIFQVHYYPVTVGKSVEDVKSNFESVLTKLKTHLPSGVPVVFGEWGAAEQDNYTHNETVLEGFATYFTSRLKEEGMAAILWRMLCDDDDINSQKNRTNLNWGREGLKDAIITGYYGPAGYVVKDCYVDIANTGTPSSSWTVKNDTENWQADFTIANGSGVSKGDSKFTFTSNAVTVNAPAGYSFSNVTLTTSVNASINGTNCSPTDGSISHNFAAGAKSFTLSGGDVDVDVTAISFRLTPDVNYYKTSNGQFPTALAKSSETLHENFLYTDGTNWSASQITLYDDIPYTLDKNVTAASFKYNRVLTSESHANGYWQPLFFPVEIPQATWETFAKTVVQFTGVDSNDANLMEYTKVTDGPLSANTPYLFMPKTSVSANIAIDFSSANVNQKPASDVAVTHGKFTLHGNYDTKADMQSTNAYGLWNGQFMRTITGAVLNPYRVYLTVNSGSSAPEHIAIKVIDPEETGLENILEDLPAADDAYYDLMGRRVENPSTGLYIHRGKKVYLR